MSARYLNSRSNIHRGGQAVNLGNDLKGEIKLPNIVNEPGAFSKQPTSLLKSDVKIIPSDSTDNPKHIYVNISTINNSTTLGTPAVFQMDFDQPYLKDCEKYYLTIVKASFPTSSLPFFNFKPDTYTVSIEFPNDAFSTTIPLVPVSISPIQFNTTSGPQTGVFEVDFYEQFLDSINNAILIAFNQVKSNPGSTFGGNIPPFLTFSPQDGKFNIIFEQGFWLPDSANGAILSFDYGTMRLFNGLPNFISAGTPAGESTLLLSNNGVSLSNSQAVNISMTGDMNKNIDYNWTALDNFSRGQVIFFDALYYASIINGNIGNRPDLSPAAWQPQGINNPNIWSAGITYTRSQIVYYPAQNSVPFISLAFPNLANVPNPAAPTAFWTPLKSGNPTTWFSGGTYEVNQNVYYPNVSSGNIYTSLTGVAGTNPSTDNVNWRASPTFVTYLIKEQFSSLPQWPDIESIVIQTGSLPIRYEVFAPPNSDVVLSGSQVPRPVLTDLDIVKDIAGFDKNPILFVPPGNYRMVDMMSRKEIKRIDVNIQIKKKDLTFQDLILLPGDFFSIKFLFIRNDAFSLV